jgi:hypothetical protein
MVVTQVQCFQSRFQIQKRVVFDFGHIQVVQMQVLELLVGKKRSWLNGFVCVAYMQFVDEFDVGFAQYARKCTRRLIEAQCSRYGTVDGVVRDVRIHIAFAHLRTY